jgi:PadR family transcriptional regulator, regulatory protein AphA
MPEDTIRLTPTSYIVLGLLADVAEPKTPYDLKAMVAVGIGNMWSLQHTQLYAEPERLAKAGYLAEVREEGGRRRKLYSITTPGREALTAWLAAQPERLELPEIRDISLLKVYFGADPGPIAAEQAAAHRAKLREYEELEQALRTGPDTGPLLALRAGIGHEREWVRYWTALAEANVGL